MCYKLHNYIIYGQGRCKFLATAFAAEKEIAMITSTLPPHMQLTLGNDIFNVFSIQFTNDLWKQIDGVI